MAVIEAIETIYCEADVTSVTFSSLGSYEHLQLQINAKLDDTGYYFSMGMRFNGDTGNNYSYQRVLGYGSNETAAVGVSASNIYGYNGDALGTPSAAYGSATIDILDYRNPNKNTTTVGFTTAGLSNTGGPRVQYATGVWDSTAALTSILVDPGIGATAFVRGSTLTLYGLNSS